MSSLSVTCSHCLKGGVTSIHCQFCFGILASIYFFYSIATQWIYICHYTLYSMRVIRTTSQKWGLVSFNYSNLIAKKGQLCGYNVQYVKGLKQ